jgi:flagellar hook-associated protein 3 FlgL
MSAPVGSSTYSALDRMLAATTSLQQQAAVLQQQTTTGKVSQSYAGLAASSAQVLNLTAASNQATAYTQSIATAQGKASAMQDALTQIGTVVTSLASAALGLTASAPSSTISSVAQQAKQALAQLGSLLNTNFAGDYVFAGADTAHPPIPSPDSLTTSGLYTQIGAQVAALANSPTTPAIGTVIANTVGIAASTAAGTTVFSSYLAGAGTTAPPVTVAIGNSQHVTLDLPANSNVGAVSDPAINGTGNAISDIMRSLAVIANSTDSMSGNPDFATLMKNAATTLTSAGNTLTQESGHIGLAQNAMTVAAASHVSLQAVLSSQLTGLTDVNMASAISQLQTVTSQLEASYKILGMANSLNLASYL